jgi:hypothetical protein
MTYGSNSILYEQLFFNISYTGSDVCRLMEMKWKTINIGYENMLGKVGRFRETMEKFLGTEEEIVGILRGLQW